MKLVGIITAYIALVLLVVMCLKPIFKRLAKKNKVFKNINKFLVKYHKHMGIMFILFVLVHGICSWSNTIKVYCAFVSCLFAILSIIFYFLRKKLNKKWLKFHLVFAVISLLFAVLHIIEANIYLPFLYDENTDIEAQTQELFDGKYKLIDGEYIGIGTGYNNGTTEVKVIIEKGVISDIVIISSEDDPFYIKKAEKSLKQYFIENQSSEVDGVAGATYSSGGYISAVLDAVEKSKES